MGKSARIWVAAVVLLTLHAWTAYDSLRIKSVTYDELTHLPAGMASVATGELALNRQHPPLVKWAAGLAASTTHPSLPLDGAAYREGKEWEFGSQVLFESNNDHWALLRRGRLPTVAFSLLGGLVVFLWARRRSGDGAALFALALWTFSPSVLAHARWVTMDAAITALGTLTLYLWWRLCHDEGADDETRRAWAPAVFCGVALGLTLGTKWSGLVLIPAMVLADFLTGPRKSLPAYWARRGSQGLVLGGTATVVLWALYLFPADPLFYVRDLGRLYADLDEGYRFYLAGSFQSERFPHYFLATFALKSTPVELLLALALAPLLWVRRRADDLFLVVPAGAWLVATSWLASNQGHRYILLLYPLLFVLSAAWVPLLAGAERTRRLVAVLAAALAVTQGLEAAGAHPDYLPYFHRFAGGPLTGPLWLDDSNVDWNQDVGRLAPWLEEKGIDSVRTVFIGRTDPEFYGLEREPFRLSDWRDGPRPGAYVISAHVLSRGLESARFEGYRSDWLVRYPPEDVLGGSLYLYVFP